MDDLTKARLRALGRYARHGADLTQDELLESVRPQLAAHDAALEAAGWQIVPKEWAIDAGLLRSPWVVRVPKEFVELLPAIDVTVMKARVAVLDMELRGELKKQLAAAPKVTPLNL